MEQSYDELVQTASELRERNLALLDANCDLLAALVDPPEVKTRLRLARKIAKLRYREAKAAQKLLEML